MQLHSFKWKIIQSTLDGAYPCHSEVRTGQRRSSCSAASREPVFRHGDSCLDKRRAVA